MEFESTIHLDLTGCETWQELHRRIKETFHFPDFYGENWDAFYDLLCTDVAADRVVISGEASVPAALQSELVKMHIAFQHAKDFNLHELNEIFTFEVIS